MTTPICTAVPPKILSPVPERASLSLFALSMSKHLFRSLFAILFVLTSFLPSAYSQAPEGEFIAESPSPGFASSWGNEIVYQIMVDRFYRPGGLPSELARGGLNEFRGGTLRGVTAKLDYLKTLGVTAILLNPIVRGDAPHGYAVVDPLEVEPRLGTLEDYKELIKQAHARGIKVIFDLVLNHLSGNSPLVRWRPEWFHPIEKETTINDGLIDALWSKLTFFLSRDLAHEREDVYQYLLAVGKYWISVGIDGFRFDAVTLGSKALFARIIEELKSTVPPSFLFLGEIFTSDQRRLNRYLTPFNAFFDFRVHDALSNSVLWGRSPALVRDTLDADRLYENQAAVPFTFIDNHDLSRFVSRERRFADERLKLGLAVLMTLRGAPTILYGTEIGLEDDPRLVDSQFDRSRSSMRFDRNEDNELFRSLRNWIALRKKYALGTARRYDIVDTNLLVNATPAPLWVTIFRTSGDEFLVAAFNFSSVSYSDIRFRLAVPGVPKEGRLISLVEKQAPTLVQGGIAPFSFRPFSANIYRLEVK